MKKILLSLLTVCSLNAAAQSAFTIEANDTTYSFPLSSTITITDNPLWEPETIVVSPEYKSNLKEVSLYGTYSTFQMRPMHLIADNLWAGKVLPTGQIKLSAVSKGNEDIFFGPKEATSNIASTGIAQTGSTNWFKFEEGFKQDSVLVVFNDVTREYIIFGLTAEVVIPEDDLVTIDFEGDKWSALIDSPEYGGPLLYGEGGYGFAEDENIYQWTDDVTSLHSQVNNTYGLCYWSGGAALSNYHCNIADGSFYVQLSIPTDMAAHSGENFLVLNGTAETSPVLDFADGTARIIKGLWLTNTSYFLHSVTIGDEYNTPATDGTFIDAVFEGFDADGNSIGSVKQRLVDGTSYINDWVYVDLSSLGKVATLKVNYEFSADQGGSNGMNAPAYIAIDDIEVCK